MSWCSDDPESTGGVVTHDGVAGWGREAMDGVIAEEPATRRSYCETVRSVDAARTVCPDSGRAMSRKGFADAVW